MRFFLIILIGVHFISCAQPLHTTVDKPIAFPGAEGFGKYTTGGRGGAVYVVTNLKDSGEGSLRDAIKKQGPRIITFAVSGTIALESDLVINNNDITIAGQSAPGDGICIRDYQVRLSADNIIIRYMRFRLGDKMGVQDDAFSGKGGKNIIIDHCSISWATDECASFYDNDNFTLQWCIISESLNASVHEKGNHGYGGIWGGRNASFHHNLIAHHNSRLPRFSGSSTTPNGPEELVDFRNNVIYNWLQNNVYGGEKGRYNVVNNYYKPGPATTKSKRERLINPSEPYGSFYLAGNYLAGFESITNDNKTGVMADAPDSTLTKVPFEVEVVPTQSAQEAFKSVLAKAGASFKRDSVDARVVREVEEGIAPFGKKTNGIIDSQNEVGGWPILTAGTPPQDSDQDGIPDQWEKLKGLNSNNKEDATQFTLHRTYTNIEVYLNSLLE